MDAPRLLDCLAADAVRLRAVAAGDLTAPVPTCPAWTVADLVRHVANGYVNVVVPRLRRPADAEARPHRGGAARRVRPMLWRPRRGVRRA